jgi:uncharacterized protein (TIGR02271 family)
MASIKTPENDLRTSQARIIAFFSNQNDAYTAINELRNAGFSSSEIGLMAGSERGSAAESGSAAPRDTESFWQKVKDFFTGDSHDDYDYRDTSSGMNWSDERADYYYNGINSGGALVSVSGPRIDEARAILQNAGGDLRESGFESAGSSRPATDQEGDRRIQLRGEILRTYKDRVQRGEVRLRKDVITETRNIEVPVTREELVIERTSGSGQSASGEIGKDEEIRVPLSEERVRTEKQPVVTEEVRVGKRAVQSTENVSDNVRHEELRVEKDGNVEVEPDTARSGKKKKPAA